jgi:universal stress protein A
MLVFNISIFSSLLQRENVWSSKTATTPGYMLARHIKPKKIVFHSRLLPHETCGMKRMQQSRKDSQISPRKPARPSVSFTDFRTVLPSTYQAQLARCPGLATKRKEMKTSSTSRSHTQQRLIRNILVPVDFSDCSLAGLKYAVRFGQEIGARIIVLHVTDLGPVMMTTGHGNYDSPAYIAAAKRRCGDQMQAFLKRVELKGVPIKTSAVAGYCPTAIHEAAAKQGADLIVISTHGRTGLRHALLGSVAEGTIRHSDCPVLVVPPDPKGRFVNRRSESTSATASAARDLT